MRTQNFFHFAMLSLFAGAGAVAEAQQYTISTVVGGGLLPSAQVAANAAIGAPSSIAADRHGNVFIGVGYGVLKMDSTGALAPVAGMGTPGDSGDSGPALKAQISGTPAVAVDPMGNVYIAEGGSGRVRKIDTNGIITTVAGSGLNTPYNNGVGDGGPAVSAPLFYPYQLAADAAGNVYIGEWNTARIRKVGTDGSITTFAGTGAGGFSGDGGPAAQAQIGSAWGLAMDSSGTLWFSDVEPCDGCPGITHIRKITPDGIITSIAGTAVQGYSGDGGPALAAQLFSPGQLAVDELGNVYFPDGQYIRKVSADGIITTIAGNGSLGYSGDGGAATGAELSGTLYGERMGLAVDTSGNILIADTNNNRVRRISKDQTIRTIAGNGGECCAPTGDEPVFSAQLSSPVGVAVDAGGNVYIADTFNDFIRKASPDGVIHIVAGVGSQADGVLASGIPATTEWLTQPAGMVFGPNGNLYIADAGNHLIREVNTSGIVTTVAGTGTAGFSGDGQAALNAQFNAPSGIAPDKNGNLYVSDTNNYRVRKIDPNGVVTTIAGTGVSGYSGDGGQATSALLSYPTGIKIDPAGNLYVADNGAVRRVTPDGIITTIAGTGVSGYSGDSGTATSAQLNAWGLALDGLGNIYVAAPSNNAVRVLRPVSGK